jgi:hypothetical protein
MQMQCKRVPNSCKQSELPPKDYTLLQISLPIWHQIAKGPSHPEAAAEEDITAEGDRTVVEELELDSNDKNDL